MFHTNPPGSMFQPIGIADRCGRAPKSSPAPELVIGQNLVQGCTVPILKVIPVGYLQPIQKCLLVDHTIPLPVAKELLPRAVRPVGGMFYFLFGSDHIHVDIKQATPQVTSTLNPGGMETVAPERSTAPARKIVVLSHFTMNELKSLGDFHIAPLPAGNQQMYMIACHHPGQNSNVKTLAGFEEVFSVHLPVFRKTEPEFPVMATMGNVVADLGLPMSLPKRGDPNKRSAGFSTRDFAGEISLLNP